MAEIDKRKTVGTGTYAGQGGAAAAVGTFVAARYAGWVPDAGGAEIAAVATISMWIVTVGVKAIRDLMHKRSSLPVTSALVLLVFGLGCGSYVIYDPSVMIDGEPVVVSRARFGGQGHFSITTNKEGQQVLEVVQHGMSDVLAGTIKGIIGAAATVFGGSGEPAKITVNVPSTPAVESERVRHVVEEPGD